MSLDNPNTKDSLSTLTSLFDDNAKLRTMNINCRCTDHMGAIPNTKNKNNILHKPHEIDSVYDIDKSTNISTCRDGYISDIQHVYSINPNAAKCKTKNCPYIAHTTEPFGGYCCDACRKYDLNINYNGPQYDGNCQRISYEKHAIKYKCLRPYNKINNCNVLYSKIIRSEDIFNNLSKYLSLYYI